MISHPDQKRRPRGLRPRRRLGCDDRGAVAIEYALLAALLALAIVGALGNLGNTLRSLPLPELINALV
jgi:Flp pilus assembly pilin Flp